MLNKSLYILRTCGASVIYNESRVLRTYLGTRIVKRETLESGVLYELAREVTFGTLERRSARRHGQGLGRITLVAEFLYERIDLWLIALLKSRRKSRYNP